MPPRRPKRIKMSASKDSEQPIEPGQTPTTRSSEEADGSIDVNPRKVDTIKHWTELMFILAGVYLSGHPAKAIEMLKYI